MRCRRRNQAADARTGAQVERRQFVNPHLALDRQADRIVPGCGIGLRRGQRAAQAQRGRLAFGTGA
jgi:hypothetical protein